MSATQPLVGDLVVDSPTAFARFAEALRPRSARGALGVLMLDHRWRLLDLATYLDFDLRERWLEVLDGLAEREPGARIVLVTNRGGRGRTARPSDEQRWERWWTTARHKGVHLVDWWVLTDTRFAYSVARYSRQPAGWVAAVCDAG